VLIGSNAFNLAAMIGLSAVIAGSVRLARPALLLEGLTGAAVTLIAAGVLLGWLAPIAAVVGIVGVLIPYVMLLTRGPRLLKALPEVKRLASRLSDSLAQRPQPERTPGTPSRPTHHLLALIVIDVALIVAGSTGMVEAALALGSQWQIAAPILGVLILAPLTSIPNAITGIRLGRTRRGSALVGETFNSNTINLAAGVVVPALFVSLTRPSSTARIDIGWLVAMTALTLVLLARPGGMRRRGGMVLIVLYLGFVVIQMVSA
jgi:cation:H+ antiporter